MLNEQIAEIAERIRGLRITMEISPEEMARVADVPVEAYVAAENVTPPDLTLGKNVDRLFVFDADTDELRDASYDRLMKELGIENYEPYNRRIEVNRV